MQYEVRRQRLRPLAGPRKLALAVVIVVAMPLGVVVPMPMSVLKMTAQVNMRTIGLVVTAEAAMSVRKGIAQHKQRKQDEDQAAFHAFTPARRMVRDNNGL